jgi:hypothetical protein
MPTPEPETEIAQAHAQELSQRLSPVYGLFAILYGSAAEPETRRQLRAAVSSCVDTLVAEEIAVDPPLEQAVRKLAEAAPELRARWLAGWAAALNKAVPRRESLKILVGQLDDWLKNTTETNRAAFFDYLPELVPSLDEFGAEGVSKMLKAAESCTGDAACAEFFGLVGNFAPEGKIMQAVCDLQALCSQAGRPELLRDIVDSAPPEAVAEDKDSRRALPQLVDTWNSLGPDAGVELAPLFCALARQSLSSAYYAVREIAKLQSPPPQRHYLQQFAALAAVVGIRVTGFSLKQLPSLYEKLGEPGVEAFVKQALEVGRMYGPTAAMWFLEGKTESARRAQSGVNP